MARAAISPHRTVASAVDLTQLLTIRWVLTTLLVLVAMGVMVRLGIWQLDRLAQRRALNARIEQGMALPPLNLNQDIPVDQLTGMSYRAATVTGRFDPSGEVVLRNQVLDSQPGYYLLTPLLIDGSNTAILVNRGWIPLDRGGPEKRTTYAQPELTTLTGRLMLSQQEPKFGGVPDPVLAPNQTRLDAWNFINLERIQQQIAQPLLPVYLALTPEDSGAVQPGMPQPASLEIDLSEGPHLSYAIQWFAFALTLGLGYPFYVRKQFRNHPIGR
jgi:surfeit locus 1 family protein